MQPKAGYKLVKTLGPDEAIVGMVEFKGHIYVATESRVFRLHASGDKLVALSFEIKDSDGIQQGE